MEKLQTHFNGKKKFTDITCKPVTTEFPETGEIGGHLFRHVFRGLYQAEPEFELSAKELEELLSKYCKLVLHVEKTEEYAKLYRENRSVSEEKRRYRVIFAYNSTYFPFRTDAIHNTLNCLDENPGYKEIAEMFDWKRFCEAEKMYSSEPPYGFSVMSEEEILAEQQRVRMEILIPERRASAPEGSVISLCGYTGYLVEEGIYYFGVDKDLEELYDHRKYPEITHLNQNAAAICYSSDSFHICMEKRVVYLATQEKYYHRLEEICAAMNAERNWYFVCTFQEKKENPDAAEEKIAEDGTLAGDAVLTEDTVLAGDAVLTEDAVLAGDGVLAEDVTLAEKEKETERWEAEWMENSWTKEELERMKTRSWRKEQVEYLLEVEREMESLAGREKELGLLEKDAEELVEGFGMRNLTVAYQPAFFPMAKFKRYRYAYKSGDDLVLMNRKGKKMVKERHSMLFLERLLVKEDRVLNCNVKYEAFHEVIGGMDKYRELLTPEAYRLYCEEKKKQEDGE